AGLAARCLRDFCLRNSVRSWCCCTRSAPCLAIGPSALPARCSPALCGLGRPFCVHENWQEMRLRSSLMSSEDS
ncbi:unnamed protein product, partial [Polarella glacialis]